MSEPDGWCHTARLLLRPLGPGDVDELVRLDADPEVRRHVDQPGAPTREEAERWLAERATHGGPGADPPYWAAELAGAGAWIGWFHLRPEEGERGSLELGYRLRREAWGHGYATEGARALVRRAFLVHDACRVVAHALAANRASLRVLEKAGLRPAGEYLHRGRLPAVRMEITREEYGAAEGG